MRRIVALMLVFILPCLLFTQEIESVPKKLTYEDGYVEGKQDGQQISQSQWFAIGCCGGPVLYYMVSGDSPDSIPEGPDEFRIGYVEGYKDASKAKKQQNALIGGIAGTVIAAVALVILWQQWEGPHWDF
jgi:hypothetical protein